MPHTPLIVEIFLLDSSASLSFIPIHQSHWTPYCTSSRRTSLDDRFGPYNTTSPGERWLEVLGMYVSWEKYGAKFNKEFYSERIVIIKVSLCCSGFSRQLGSLKKKSLKLIVSYWVFQSASLFTVLREFRRRHPNTSLSSRVPGMYAMKIAKCL